MLESTPNGKRAATNEDTCGPYYPISFGDAVLEDLTRVPGIVGGPTGTHILLRGCIRDRYGDPAHGVLMEFWQANAAGVYRTPATSGHPDLDPWFDGFGKLRAHTGDFAFRTILPGAPPGRAPHITITLFSDGISRIVTQLFFANHPDNDGDPVLSSLPPTDRSRLIAHPEERLVDGATVYVLDIVMAGSDETPFFDDLEV